MFCHAQNSVVIWKYCHNNVFYIYIYIHLDDIDKHVFIVWIFKSLDPPTSILRWYIQDFMFHYLFNTVSNTKKIVGLQM